MKKGFLAFVLTGILVCGFPVCAGAAEDSDGGLAKKTGETIQSGEFMADVLEDDTVIITAVDSRNEFCEGIPEEIEGYPVSGIGKRAFEYKEFEELIIPESVKVIDEEAFCYATVTDALSFPENIRIEAEAFSYALLPEEFTIPNGAYAGVEAFAYLEGTESLQIGDGAVIDDECFSYAEDLVNVAIGADAMIGDEAFSYCDYLESAVIGEGTYLADSAFDYCDALSDVDIAGGADVKTGGSGSDDIEIEKNTDTLADWNIRVVVPDGAEAVLDGNEYYIYPEEMDSIPYVMLRTYDYDSTEEFLADFTEYMGTVYDDLEVIAEPVEKTIGDKSCMEIDYSYAVQGYEILDRRIATTVGDMTYMFASKEVPELDIMIGSMLEDVVAASVFLTDEGTDILTGGGEDILLDGNDLAEDFGGILPDDAVDSAGKEDGFADDIDSFLAGGGDALADDIDDFMTDSKDEILAEEGGSSLAYAYAYYLDDGMVKYWVDFTGAMADDIVLHCYFISGDPEYYESNFILDLDTADIGDNKMVIHKVEDMYGLDHSNWFKSLVFTLDGGQLIMDVVRDESTLAGGAGDNILTGTYVMEPVDDEAVYEYYMDDGQLVF